LLAANVSRIRESTNFGVLLRVMDEVLGNVDGLGELFVYDTALRVGAHLGMLPTQVFLHAGTRAGAEALGLDCTQRFLFRSDMPEAFRALAAHEIEDVLCIYTDQFVAALRGQFEPPEFVWCFPIPDEQ
jgi:hypothetical protein